MQEKRKTLLDRLAYSGLMNLNEDNNIHYVFDPSSNSIMKLTWQSPNDKLYNMVNFYVDPNDNTFMKIKDRH